MTISKRFSFEASHVLPRHPGKCSRLHGHSYGLVVVVWGTNGINPATGFVMDYGVLKEIVEEHVVSKLDHTHLGQGIAHFHGEGQLSKQAEPYFGLTFYPSAENLSRAIFKLLAPFINDIQGVKLAEITIEETCTTSATWRDVDEYDEPTRIERYRALPTGA